MYKFLQVLFRRPVHGTATTPAQARLLADLRLTAWGVVYAGDDLEDPGRGTGARTSYRHDARRQGTRIAVNEAGSLHGSSCATTSFSSGQGGTPCIGK
jgi:hypothetical protein